MSVVTDYPDNSPHFALAQQVAATGVPLLQKASVLYNDLGRVILGGGSFTEVTKLITQPGYTISVNVQFPAAATIPFVEVRLVWEDQATVSQMNTDTFICAGNTAGAGLTTFLTGRCKGDELSVALVNLDPAQSATITLIAAQDSVVRTRDEARWNTLAAAGTTVPGYTLATLAPDETVMGIVNDLIIPASTTLPFLFGIGPGLAQFSYEMNNGVAASLMVRMRPQPDTYYAANNWLGDTSAPPFSFQFIAPRAPIVVRLVNTATTSITVTCGMVSLV